MVGRIADEVQRGGSIGGFDDRHPSAAKHLHDSPAKGRFILHDQDGSRVAPYVRGPRSCERPTGAAASVVAGRRMREFVPRPEFGLETNETADALDNAMHDRKTQAVAGRFGGEERVEHLGLGLGPDTAAGIGNLEVYVSAGGGRANRNDPVPIPDGFRRIGDEIHDDLAKLSGVGVDGGEPAGEAPAAKPRVWRPRPEELDHLLD